MTSVTCDRCKKIIPIENRYPKYSIEVVKEWFHNGGYLSDRLDLCQECEREFEQWLKKK